MAQSIIIKNLPSYFQEEDGFLDQFLKGFEDMLIGNPGSHETSRASMKSVSYILDNIDKYFDPLTTPPQFLEWLGQWVGYELKRGPDYNHEHDVIENEYVSPIGQHLPLQEERKSYNRVYLSEVVKLYQKRGTLVGIEEFLEKFINAIEYNPAGFSDLGIEAGSVVIKDIVSFRIDEYLQPFILGRSARVGRDTVLGDSRPYYFSIRITLDFTRLPFYDAIYNNGSNKYQTFTNELSVRIIDDITNFLDTEKPGHVYYYYDIITIDE